MTRLSVWLGAGLVTAGLSVAMIAGAAVASADDGASDSHAVTASAPAKPDAERAGPSSRKFSLSDRRSFGLAKSDMAKSVVGQSDSGNSRVTLSDLRRLTRPVVNNKTSKMGADTLASDMVGPSAADGKRKSPIGRLVRALTDATAHGVLTPAKPMDTATAAPLIAKFDRLAKVDQLANVLKDQSLEALPAPTAVVAEKSVTSALNSVVGLIASAAFNTLTGLETVVTGPPKLPPNSTVTVKTSTLQIADGQVVPANWYYPAGDEPPKRMILLQHGFLATGPMYSYTAAYLAESTNSIVVTPTLTSNPYAAGGLWLGGDAEAQAVADLFVGDREALTDSAIAAGYADQYDFGTAPVALPLEFALVGHSLGGALVSGVAGDLAADPSGAADNLVGVILLDGVPTGDQLTNALVKLDDYEERTGRYIPVREIGAPLNLFNAPSNVNEALTAARPDEYNGVVLDGGVHMDSMLGGNPLIQFVAYLVAGFPQKQNPPAVQELATSWLNDWFDPTVAEVDPAPGSSIDIVTSAGVAHGVVLGGPTSPLEEAVRDVVRFLFGLVL